MDLEQIKDSIVTSVYHIDASKKVPLHKHNNSDEIFYCIAGCGYGVLEESEVELTVGKVFVVPAGIMHSLRTDKEFYISSFLIPVAKEAD